MSGDILTRSVVPLKFLIQAAYVTSPYNNAPLFYSIRNVTNRVTDFAALTAQNCALVKGLRQEKYTKVIASLDNVKYIKGLGKLVRSAG
jgi:pyruvate/2-oxoglutarate dehydrogenase complex dihydrolipoamide dehydrogenase (E3) component